MNLALANERIRGVKAEYLAATWPNYEHEAQLKNIWSFSGKQCLEAGYHSNLSISRRNSRLDYFVSHAWGMPPVPIGSQQIFKSKEIYDNCRANVLRAAIDGAHKDIGRVYVWLDKVCQPQDDENIAHDKQYNYFFMENLLLSKAVIICCSPNYFQRLWCLYEFSTAMALARDVINEVIVSYMDFVSHSSQRMRAMEMYVDSVKSISVSTAQCEKEEDRVQLIHQINKFYNSHSAFESFAKVSAIAMLAKEGCRGAIDGLGDQLVVMWIPVAKELDFKELSDAIALANVTEWYAASVINNCIYSDKFFGLINEWYHNNVADLVKQYANLALRSDVRGSVLAERDSFCESFH